MAEYHVGCGFTAIFAGTLNKKKDRWVNKSDVTDEAFKAVAQYCLEHDEAMNFDYYGKRYRLCVEEYKIDYLGVDPEYAEDELPNDDFRYGMERALEIIDKYISGKE